MAKTRLVIRQDDIKIRKKPAPPGKAHKSAKAYTRKNKHPKRESDPVAGPSHGRASIVLSPWRFGKAGSRPLPCA
jgi:hypothetical protein